MYFIEKCYERHYTMTFYIAKYLWQIKSIKLLRTRKVPKNRGRVDLYLIYFTVLQ